MAEQNNTERESVADERARMRSEEMRLRKLKRKREKREKIKRLLILGVVIVIALLAGLFAVFSGTFEKRSAENLLTVNADLSLVYEEIEDNTESKFDKAEMKSYIKGQIASFNSTEGKGSIKLSRFDWKEDKVYLRTKYKSIDAYSKFTGYHIYNGDLTGALAAGYEISPGIKKVADGKIGKDDATSADMEGKKLFIIRENTSVKLPGKIIAVSTAGVELTAEDTVRISSVSDEEDAALQTVIVYE